MALILSIETSSKVCSLALHNDGNLVETDEKSKDYSHDESLMIMIKSMLEKVNTPIGDLDAIAVSGGPGSYTGLRIGVSAAKGLCFALDLPMIAVNTLEALVKQVVDKQDCDFICPMLDARRMEVYYLLAKRNGETTIPTDAMVVDENSFTDTLQHSSILFFASGAQKCKEIIHSENAVFLDEIYPNAISVGQLATGKYRKGDFVDLNNYEPLYLKPVNITKPRNLLDGRK